MSVGGKTPRGSPMMMQFLQKGKQQKAESNPLFEEDVALAVEIQESLDAIDAVKKSRKTYRPDEKLVVVMRLRTTGGKNYEEVAAELLHQVVKESTVRTWVTAFNLKYPESEPLPEHPIFPARKRGRKFAVNEACALIMDDLLRRLAEVGSRITSRYVQYVYGIEFD